MTLIVSLHPQRDRLALDTHFAGLAAEDLRYRFCAATTCAGVADYLDWLGTHGMPSYGAFNPALGLMAVCQLGPCGDELELGLSVLPAYRRQGIARALFERAVHYARDWGYNALLVHCLADNAPMLSLARRIGMDVQVQAGEAEGRLILRAGVVDHSISGEDHAEDCLRGSWEHGPSHGRPLAAHRPRAECL